ncbi:MAG: hypothetical protein K9K86_07675 [Pseudomonadales bacterium]|nr:hypothetical protein [Pseudomonadales bacterium]
MRALAEYAMRGRSQAVTVAAISAALPLFFWVSAAIVALTILRKGVTEGLNLFLWASLPTIIWILIQKDPTPLIIIAGSGLLATVLRTSVSWVYTLLTGVLLGIVLSELMPFLLPEVVAETIRISKEVLSELAAQTKAETGRHLDEWLHQLFAGILGSVHLFAMTGCLVLGRWWQASLYNPGGFRIEFHQLILPKAMTLPMMLLMVFGGGMHPIILGWVPVMSVPFIIAGIALVHGIVGIRKLPVQWLLGFYILVFFMGPYFYPLLIVMAFLDSMLDFRQRIRPSAL